MADMIVVDTRPSKAGSFSVLVPRSAETGTFVGGARGSRHVSVEFLGDAADPDADLTVIRRVGKARSKRQPVAAR